MLLGVYIPFSCVPIVTTTSTVFTLSQAPIVGTLSLYKNGLFMIPTTTSTPDGDYVLSGSQIILVDALVEGDKLYAQGIC